LESSTEYLEFSKRLILNGSLFHCQYAPNAMQSLNSSLTQHIKGQSEGISTIINAFDDWEFRKSSGTHEPLVLAITGPTGVGKSETAFRIGQALFSKTTQVGSSEKFLPCGLLVLRGEDYSPSSEAYSKGLPEIHKIIRTQIIDHIVKCEGNTVIVFDEVQKVAPGTLEVRI
jgi:Cdc6-like AAA superfamily ATPase